MQYFSINCCSSPDFIAFLAIRFKIGEIRVRNPGAFISLMLIIKAVFFKLLGIDFLLVKPSTANPYNILIEFSNPSCPGFISTLNLIVLSVVLKKQCICIVAMVC